MNIPLGAAWQPHLVGQLLSILLSVKLGVFYLLRILGVKKITAQNMLVEKNCKG